MAKLAKNMVTIYNLTKFCLLVIRKTKRTAKGTLLVSLSIRNLLLNSFFKGDCSLCFTRLLRSAQLNNITLHVPYRVIVLTCGMTGAWLKTKSIMCQHIYSCQKYRGGNIKNLFLQCQFSCSKVYHCLVFLQEIAA